MLQVETALIRIQPAQVDVWQIEVPFRVSGPLGRYSIDVTLDRQMIPLGPEHQGGGQSLTLGFPPSLSMDMNLSRSNVRIDPGRRLIRFPFNWMDAGQVRSGSNYNVRKTIPFKWVSKLRLPDSISLEFKVRGLFGGTVLQKRVLGFNLASNSIIPVLCSGPAEGTFYYSTNNDLGILEYRDVVRIGTVLLDRGDTASWAFTGPDDTELWESNVGVTLLSSQYRRIVQGAGSHAAYRLALCPYELGLSEQDRARFVEMMEVQRLCGIGVHVVTPSHVEQTTGSARRVVGGFGRGFAAEWEWGSRLIEPERAAIHFEQDRITALRAQYEEMVAQAVPWVQYKAVRGIEFPRGRGTNIASRVRRIRGSIGPGGGA